MAYLFSTFAFLSPTGHFIGWLCAVKPSYGRHDLLPFPASSCSSLLHHSRNGVSNTFNFLHTTANEVGEFE
jgi:hypothetical protein